MITIEHDFKKLTLDSEEKALSAELKRYARERRPSMVDWILGRLAEHIQEKDTAREAKEKEAAIQNEVATEIRERQAKLPTSQAKPPIKKKKP